MDKACGCETSVTEKQSALAYRLKRPDTKKTSGLVELPLGERIFNARLFAIRLEQTAEKLRTGPTRKKCCQEG